MSAVREALEGGRVQYRRVVTGDAVQSAFYRYTWMLDGEPVRGRLLKADLEDALARGNAIYPAFPMGPGTVQVSWRDDN